MQHRPEVFVFAYGSNLCMQRMRSRVLSAQAVSIGYVGYRRLVFHKRGVDGSAKANAAYSAVSTDRIWGVVYRLTTADKSILDEYESLGVGYDQEEVDVVHVAGSRPAWMYVARSEAIAHSLLPYSWYHDYIVQGACQHGLPESYIDHLRSFESLVDPDSARHARNRELIES
jgi:gamma-glutamylcyclotransferase (GGCT)/AIG2-like uncharacterized protein YtfP